MRKDKLACFYLNIKKFLKYSKLNVFQVIYLYEFKI